MQEFKYITDKILDAPFFTEPFKHLYIENLLSNEHLEMLQSCEQIKLNPANSTEELIKTLKNKGYSAIKFPGCTTSVKEYLNWYNNKQTDQVYNGDIVEAFGMAFNLENIKSQEIKNLVNFLNSDHFHQTLHKKFNITRESRVTTRIQKYLTGYEISPHPDVRSKCLTYLININTESAVEKQNVHTHLLKFKPKYRTIYNYWESNPSVDRCWVPWEWCETKKYVSKNNSLVMFAPSNDTLHAVKLEYNHLPFQRTQLYGNLWYTKKVKAKEAYYQNLPV